VANSAAAVDDESNQYRWTSDAVCRPERYDHVMATIYTSRGTVGAGSTDPGRPQSLPVLDQRLKERGFSVHYLGPQPRPIHPPGEWLLYTVIKVGPEDTPAGMFTQRGFYYVDGLHAEDSGFLSADTVEE
jgi:hypothetical protein